MKISKTIAATVLAFSLMLPTAVAASASDVTTLTPVVTATDAPVIPEVSEKDRKAVETYRKIKARYEKQQAKLAARAEFQAAMTAWRDAMTAWQATNSGQIAALKTIKTNFNVAIKAADNAHKAAMTAAKTAADPQVARAFARANKAAAVAAAVASRNEAIKALGPIPAKPVKPVNDGKGKVKGHGHDKGKKN